MYKIIVNFWHGNRDNKNKIIIDNVADIKSALADLKLECSHFLYESGLNVKEDQIHIDNVVVVSGSQK